MRKELPLVTNYRAWLSLVLAVLVSGETSSTADDVQGPASPVRIADVISGHVHPSLAVTRSGTLLAVFNIEGGGGKELHISRSIDGGRSWSERQPIPGICDCSIYPGSLTVLGDGRIVLNWSCYRPDYSPAHKETQHREPQYAISDDDGRTWSAPRTYPLENLTRYTCMRNPVMELADGAWVLPLYDRTALFQPEENKILPFGDGRNHGMVPIVRTPQGTMISGTPDADSPVPGGAVKRPVGGLRSTDGGQTWKPLRVFPQFGVAGYDLIVLNNGWIVLTAIDYDDTDNFEIAFRLVVSKDDGETWSTDKSVVIHSPGRRIRGRGWPRTVQIDRDTLGTVFFDLDSRQSGGPGLFFLRTPLKALK
jgi:hypothetical protein